MKITPEVVIRKEEARDKSTRKHTNENKEIKLKINLNTNVKYNKLR